jgi:hypothetical protein
MTPKYCKRHMHALQNTIKNWTANVTFMTFKKKIQEIDTPTKC